MKSKRISKSLVAGLLSMVLMVAFSFNGMVIQAAEKPTISHETLSIEIGSVYKLLVKNADKVTWKSNDSKIAKVSSTGTVTAVKVGKAAISATAGKTTLKCNLTVTKSDEFASVFYNTWEGNIGKVKLTSKNIGQKMYDITYEAIGGYPATDYKFTAAIKDSKGIVTAYYKATHKENNQIINEYKFKITVKGDNMTVYYQSAGKYSKMATYTK